MTKLPGQTVHLYIIDTGCVRKWFQKEDVSTVKIFMIEKSENRNIKAVLHIRTLTDPHCTWSIFVSCYSYILPFPIWKAANSLFKCAEEEMARSKRTRCCLSKKLLPNLYFYRDEEIYIKYIKFLNFKIDDEFFF